MKTFTLVVCLLFSALASYATAPPSGYLIKNNPKNTFDDHSSVTAEPFNVCLEAENSNGTGPVTDDPNASGGKTRGDQNDWNHYVDYDVNGVTAGRYQLTIRYYAEGNATVNVSVNGALSVPAVALPATNSWNIVWADKTIEVDLSEGNNRIRIQGQPGSSVRQDRICLSGGGGTGEPVVCNFSIAPTTSKPSYEPAEDMIFYANCSGENYCTDVTFTWTGNGISRDGNIIGLRSPSALGTYTYILTAVKNGCPIKTDSVTVVVEIPQGCNFQVVPTVSDATPACSEPISLNAICSGPDCAGVNYVWSGNGVNNQSAQNINLNAPPGNGTYNYNLFVNKQGCYHRISTVSIDVSCETGPIEPFSACVEAEDSNSDGAITEDPNASNGKTRGTQESPSYFVEYEVNGVKATGTHQITLRYYAPVATAVAISINGEMVAPQVGLGPSNSWNIVSREQTFSFTLKEGSNKIRIYCFSGYGPVRQDRICVTGSGGTGNPPTCEFDVTATSVRISPSCRDATALVATCNGFDCNSVNYQWTGQGIDLQGRIVYLNPPGQNGTFTYTVTATKNACPPKTATVSFTAEGCEPTGEPFSACVEAEHSASNGPGSDDPNASNGQTRGAQDNYDYYVDYAINDVPASGFYPVTLRYYAAENAQVSVTINGVLSVPSLPLAATNSWNIVWREETLYITLFKGNNVVRIQGLPGAACRQDRFCVHPPVSTVRMAAPGSAEMQNDIPLLQAYPNPAPGEFEAVFHLETGKPGTIQVTDIQGKVWHERKLKGQGSHKERITLGNAPTGIYLLQIKKPDSVETKKILLTH